MQVIREVVSRLSGDGVDLIAKYLYNVGLSGTLMEMILLALSRETEKTVDCALQVCYQLARKAGSLYLPLMSRNGIMRMIGTISQVLQLPKYDYRVIGRGNRGGFNSDGPTHVSDAVSVSNTPLLEYGGDKDEHVDMHLSHE